jgi:hypothetical protein
MKGKAIVTTRQLASLVERQTALSPLEAMRPVPMQRDFIVAIAAEALAARQLYESACAYLTIVGRQRHVTKPHLTEFIGAVEKYKKSRAESDI